MIWLYINNECHNSLFVTLVINSVIWSIVYAQHMIIHIPYASIHKVCSLYMINSSNSQSSNAGGSCGFLAVSLISAVELKVGIYNDIPDLANESLASYNQ